MEYHIFKKPKKLKSGKTVHRWYYYYLDENKKQVQKACKGCKSRKEAEDYIRALPNADMKDSLILLKDVAETMFLLNSEHLDRRNQLGKPLDIETILQARRYTESIIDTWGDKPIDKIDPAEVTKFLFTVKHSGSWKNRYISIFREICTEAQWYGCKTPPPHFQRFNQKPRKADILTTDELRRLFVPENFPDDTFYLFFLLCLSGGLRLGEVRAVRPKQLLADKKALIVDGFCKVDGTRTSYNKTGTPDNPRFRLVLLPDFTTALVTDYIAAHGIAPEDFCFTVKDKPIKQRRAQYVFTRALMNAGIAISREDFRQSDKYKPGKQIYSTDLMPDGRKLSVHSLRYTYVTRMRRELPAETVMKLVGHTSIDMTDYYTNHAIEESLAGLIGVGTAVDNLFN